MSRVCFTHIVGPLSAFQVNISPLGLAQFTGTDKHQGARRKAYWTVTVPLKAPMARINSPTFTGSVMAEKFLFFYRWQCALSGIYRIYHGQPFLDGIDKNLAA